jgi:hypothetical protein
MTTNSAVLTTPAAVATPQVVAISPVLESEGYYVVRISYSEPPAGWYVRAGLPLGPWEAVPESGIIRVGTLGGPAPRRIAAFISNATTGENSRAVTIPLTVPDAAIPLVGPTVAADLADISVFTGGTATADLSSGFTGDDLVWSITVAGAAPPAGWSISSAGVLTYPVAVAGGPFLVVVTVSSNGLTASQTIEVTVSVAPVGDPPISLTTAGVFQNVAGGSSAAPGQVWRVIGNVWAGGVTPFTTEWRVMSGATVVRTWAAMSVGYTIVEADRGDTLTAQVRRVDSRSPTPETYTFNPTGSAAVPTGTVVGTLVSTLADLNTAIQNSVAGDTIRLAPGTYGAPTIAGVVKAGGQVKIVASETANPPRIAATTNTGSTRDLNLAGSAGWIFDNLILGPAADPAVGDRALNSANVGYSNARRITLRNMLMLNRNSGMSSDGGCEDIIVEASEITKMEMDGIRLYNRARRVTFRNLRIHGHVPHPTRNDHRDGIQMATLENNANIEDLTIENCHITGLGNVRVQGIILRNGWILGPGPNPPNGAPPYSPTFVWPAQAHQRVTVRNNLIEVRCSEGLGVSCVLDALYERNTLRTLAGTYFSDSDPERNPRINAPGPSTGRVRNNVQPHATIFYRTETHPLGFTLPGRANLSGYAGMWTEVNVTNSTSAFPTDWVTPVVGRGALGY